MNDGRLKRNWAELPPELTAWILLRLSVFDILENAQKVCRSWRRVCTKDPSMWRKIEMPKLEKIKYSMKEAICRRAIDLSQGGLLEIYLEDFASDSLLSYIAHSSSNLKRLGLAKCIDVTNVGLLEALVKLPLLEELEISHSSIEDLDLKSVGLSCPCLKTLKLNCVDYKCFFKCDNDALAIAQTMPGLRHLQLIGSSLSDTALNAILDGCSHLEHLDLRRCLHVSFDEDVWKRCLERIKDVRHPNDSTADYPFHYVLADHDLLEEEAFDEEYIQVFEDEEEDNYSYGSDDNEYVYDDIYGDDRDD